jgi:hypothetical protein
MTIKKILTDIIRGKEVMISSRQFPDPPEEAYVLHRSMPVTTLIDEQADHLALLHAQNNGDAHTLSTYAMSEILDQYTIFGFTEPIHLGSDIFILPLHGIDDALGDVRDLKDMRVALPENERAAPLGRYFRPTDAASSPDDVCAGFGGMSVDDAHRAAFDAYVTNMFFWRMRPTSREEQVQVAMTRSARNGLFGSYEEITLVRGWERNDGTERYVAAESATITGKR